MEIKLNEQERCSLERQNSRQSSRQSMQSYWGDLVARTLRMVAHTKEVAPDSKTPPLSTAPHFFKAVVYIYISLSLSLDIYTTMLLPFPIHMM